MSIAILLMLMVTVAEVVHTIQFVTNRAISFPLLLVLVYLVLKLMVPIVAKHQLEISVILINGFMILYKLKPASVVF